MADFAPNHALGEDVLKTAEKKLFEYSGTVTAGDFLEVSGVTTDGMLTVATQAGTDPAVAVAQFDGVSGDRRECIFRGETKVTFGANTTVGKRISVSGNKAIDQAVVGDGLDNGYSISDAAADLDTGYIHFEGRGL